MSSVFQKQVEIYAIFFKLNSVNTVQSKFDGEVDIVSSWLDTIHDNYDPEHHWNPQLICENAIEKEIKIRTRIEIKTENDSENHTVRIVQYQKFSGIFSEWLHVKQFPFDVQKIGIDFFSHSNNFFRYFHRSFNNKFTSNVSYNFNW
jgi:hypothetical protein